MDNSNFVSESKAIIRAHQQKTPVSTIDIANALGLKVWKVGRWPNNVSGMIRKDEENGGVSGYAIYVNSNHHVNRRRFTIAHEIAHFVLHRELIGDGIVEDVLLRSERIEDKHRLDNRIEAQANQLAADILMPWHLLDPILNGGTTNIKEIASTFEVSASAMSIRLGVPFEGETSYQKET